MVHTPTVAGFSYDLSGLNRALPLKLTTELQESRTLLPRAKGQLAPTVDYVQGLYRQIILMDEECKHSNNLSDSRKQELEKLQIRATAAETKLASSTKECSRWKEELDSKSKELEKVLEFRHQQQEGHQREIKAKEDLFQKATLDAKTAKNELSQFQKQAQKKIKKAQTALKDAQKELEAKDMELGMVTGNQSNVEARAATAEDAMLGLKAENQELKKQRGAEERKGSSLIFQNESSS